MRQRHWWIVGLLLLGLAGCGGTKPCLVIPAQLELARDTRDAARSALDEKVNEMERWDNAIKQSNARIDRLKEDRDRLQQGLDDSGSEEGNDAEEGKK
jgi:predicted  nucleic acid-binding Zn-ribbon protein